MMLRRFGVLGDVHTEDRALELALGVFEVSELDAILCVGDIVDGRGDADRTCQLLRDANVLAVRGNHDRWFLRGTSLGMPDDTRTLDDSNREWLAALPPTRRFETPLGGLLLCHGVGDDDMAVLRSSIDEYALAWLAPLHRLQASRASSSSICRRGRCSASISCAVRFATRACWGYGSRPTGRTDMRGCQLADLGHSHIAMRDRGP